VRLFQQEHEARPAFEPPAIAGSYAGAHDGDLI